MKTGQKRPRHAVTPGDRVVRLMTDLCRHAEADLRRMPDAPAQAVHALRVRMKKLRSLLRLVRGTIPQAQMNRLRRLIRQIKDAFARTRDLEVLQKLAKKMQRRLGLPALELRSATRHTAAAASARTLAAARLRIVLLRREVAALPLTKLTPEEVVARYAQCQHGCRRRMKKCASGGDAAALHRWRKRVKEWYYLSLALGRLPHALKCVRPARELGHLLGQVNDLRLLDAHVSGTDSAAQWRKAIARRVRRKKSRLFAVAAKSLHLPERRLQKVLTRQMDRLAAG